MIRGVFAKSSQNATRSSDFLRGLSNSSRWAISLKIISPDISGRAFQTIPSMSTPLSGFHEDPEDLLRRRLEASTRLVEMTRRLASETNIDRILEIVTSECRPALNCDRASLFVHDAARREVFTRVVTELEQKEIRQGIDRGVVGWVVRHRQTAVVQDVDHDPRWSGSVDDSTGYKTHNLLAVPVFSRDNDAVLGVLEVLNKRSLFDANDEVLLQAFASHAGAALDRSVLLDRLKATQAIEQALEAARNVQAALLPAVLPRILGYELAAWWQPAEAVGGDYYDVVSLSDGNWALAVADVSGHGLGPALIMASARAMLHVLTKTSSKPSRITMLLASFDPVRHEVRFANAGHGPAFLYRRASKTFVDLDSTGLPVGILEDRYKESPTVLKLEPGDLLVLATDGVVEQRNEAGELFGKTQFQEIIAASSHLPATDIVEAVKEALTRHFRGHHPDDDVTLLIVERKLPNRGS
jgi:phosphoserine phosphatase RsbU/P